MKFIEVHMFIEQRKLKGNGRTAYSPSLPAPAIPFKDWKVGYIVRSKGGDQFTIRKIISEGGVMKYQDCEVELENVGGEKRLLKGATLQSGYEFVSKGDVVEDTTKPGERSDVAPMSVAIDGIREFMPRSEGREGSRIVMKDKTSYAVMEPYEDVKLAIKQAAAS